MFVAVLIACSLQHCYRMGLYSHTEFATKEDCLNAFSFIAVMRDPPDTHLHVRCLSKKEWLMLPEFPRKNWPRSEDQP